MRLTRALICVLVTACFADPPPVQSGVSGSTGAGTTGGATSNATSNATDPGDDSTSSDVTGVASTSTTASTGADDDTDASGDESATVGTTGAPVETPLVDLVAVLCDAQIRSYEDPACGGDCVTDILCNEPGLDQGHALALQSANFEGTVLDQPTIEMAAYPSAQGLITAHFDGISLEGASQPRLRATAWCGDQVECEAYWNVEIVGTPPGGSRQIVSETGVEIVDGAGMPIDIDLSAVAGAVVRVTLRMSNHGEYDPADRIRYAAPRVVDLE